MLPQPVPPTFYDELVFEGPASSCAFMRLRQKKKGRTVPAGLIMGGSEDEQRLKREGAEWLAGG